MWANADSAIGDPNLTGRLVEVFEILKRKAQAARVRLRLERVVAGRSSAVGGESV